jgi:transglutaminase-like putative cysteine protease
MRLELANRVSGYLTLVAATACLACAAAPLLPPWLLFVPALVLLVAAFVAEGRGWVLSVPAANCVAGLILLVIVGGLAAPFLRDPSGFVALAPDLLTYVGPFLIVLVFLKLVRPKRANDLWQLQGIGLLMTALGAALAPAGPFGALLLAYLVFGAWHLALAYLRREEMRAEPAAAPARVPWRGLGVAQGGRWVLAAGCLALPAFFLAPRAGDETWTPLGLPPGPGPRAMASEVGMTDLIDLNRTGTLTPDDDVVVEVQAFADAALTEPKIDVDPGQRWRGPTLDDYDNGRWQPGQWPAVAPAGMGPTKLPAPSNANIATPQGPGEGKLAPSVVLLKARQQTKLPDFGPGQYFLNFSVVPRKAGGLVLAEPVTVRTEELPALPVRDEDRARLFLRRPGGALASAPPRNDRQPIHYRQAVPAIGADPGDTVPVSLSYANRLVQQQPVEALGPWASELTRRLAEQPGSGLRPGDLEPVLTPGGWTGPREPQRVARALTTYFASSGEYRYSFDQERSDPGLDPTLDFLVNVKSGPCNRYAAGLALVLRALGVPARVVVGYRGCQHLGEGRYQILASQAHAWVEALVWRQAPDGAPQAAWLALDPTPSADAVPRPSWSFVRWWESHRLEGLALWREFILEYNPATQRTEVLGPITDMVQGSWHVRPGRLLLVLGGPMALALGVGYVVWGRRRRPARRGARVPFYARLLDVLAKVHGLRPLPAQTPREFAAAAGRALRERGRDVVADVPARVAELFYRVAYGGRPLTEDESRDVARGLDALGASSSA